MENLRLQQQPTHPLYVCARCWCRSRRCRDPVAGHQQQPPRGTWDDLRPHLHVKLGTRALVRRGGHLPVLHRGIGNLLMSVADTPNWTDPAAVFRGEPSEKPADGHANGPPSRACLVASANLRVLLYRAMVRATRVGIRDRHWLLEATLPRLDLQYETHASMCQQTDIHSYSNATGRHAKCRMCGTRWIWIAGRSTRVAASPLQRIFALIGAAIDALIGQHDGLRLHFEQRKPRTRSTTTSRRPRLT